MFGLEGENGELFFAVESLGRKRKINDSSTTEKRLKHNSSFSYPEARVRRSFSR